MRVCVRDHPITRLGLGASAEAHLFPSASPKPLERGAEFPLGRGKLRHACPKGTCYECVFSLGERHRSLPPRRSLRGRGGPSSVRDINARSGHKAHRRPIGRWWRGRVQIRRWEPEGWNRGFRPSVAHLLVLFSRHGEKSTIEQLLAKPQFTVPPSP